MRTTNRDTMMVHPGKWFRLRISFRLNDQRFRELLPGVVKTTKVVKMMPACDFAAISDVIDSNDTGNDALLEERPLPRRFGARVWHMHENLHRRERLTSSWPQICIGRASAFTQVGMAECWVSTGKAMRVGWDDDGRPTCKLYGRPMLDPAIFDHLPCSSADSTNTGHTIGVGYA